MKKYMEGFLLGLAILIGSIFAIAVQKGLEVQDLIWLEVFLGTAVAVLVYMYQNRDRVKDNSLEKMGMEH